MSKTVEMDVYTELLSEHRKLRKFAEGAQTHISNLERSLDKARQRIRMLEGQGSSAVDPRRRGADALFR